MPRSITPPYRTVALALKERIDSGEWLPGEQLPTLRELSAQYDVSISTARRALGELRESGLIVITPGWGAFRSEV